MEVRLEQSGPDANRGTGSKAAQGSKRKGQKPQASAGGCYWSSADTAVNNSMTQAALRNGSSVQIQQSDVCVVTSSLNSETNDNVSSLPEVHCYRPGWTVSEAQAVMVHGEN